MLKHKLILGITIIAAALVMTLIGPLASADDNNNKDPQAGDNQKHDHDNKHQDDDEHQDNDEHHDDNEHHATTSIHAQKCPDGQYIVGIDESGKIICASISIGTGDTGGTGSGNQGGGNTDTSPTSIYLHLDVGTCTTDPITSVQYGWCPNTPALEFHLRDPNVTQYSVIAITVVPPVAKPLATVSCAEESINYTVGTNQGFGILCGSAPQPGSGLNYIIFNPTQNWYDKHNIKHP